MINNYKNFTKEIQSTKYFNLVNEASDRLLEFSQRLIHGNNFTIVKFGDGELRNMISNNEREHNCDGNFYFRKLGDELIEAYIYFLKHNTTYICKWHSHEYEIQNRIEEDYKNEHEPTRKFLYYDILIHKLPISIEQLQFFKTIKYIKREKLYISNKDLLNVVLPILNVQYGFEIPSNNTYIIKDNLYNEIDKFMLSKNNPENMIIMLSVGMFSKVIIAHLSKKYPNNTYLDIGSSFDGLVHPSRDFMHVKNYKDEMLIHYNPPNIDNNKKQEYLNYEMSLIHFDKYKLEKPKQNILVLGSRGVIGKGLTNFLKNKGHNVIEWDIKINPDHDLRLSCPDLDNYDFIYFLAYDIGGAKYLYNPTLDFINNNMLIMKNVFNKLEQTFKKLNKKIPFIFASSQMQNMNNTYGTLKRIGEEYTQLLGGISTRFWNVYGDQDYGVKSHVLTDMLYKYNTKGYIDLMTDGQEERQFFHTDDCAEALYTLQLYYDVFSYRKHIDITSGVWTKIYDLALMITKDDKKIIVSDKKDFTHIIRNEPNLLLLNYWKPKITLEKYIMDKLKID